MQLRLTTGLVLLTLLACHIADTPPTEYTHFSLRQLGQGTYAAIHKFGGKAICNAGIIDNGEATIVFDAFLSPEAAKELIQATQDLELSPIKYVVNSHYHNDHIRGNQSFAPDVQIIATKLTAEKIAEEEPKAIMAEKVYGKVQFVYFDSLMNNYQGDTSLRAYQVAKMMRPYFEALSQSHEKIRTRLPDVYVNGEMDLSGTSKEVKLIDMGNCHSASDLVLYLPAEGILFTGDITFHNFHPYLANGNPNHWKTKLIEIREMDINHLVPGHGEPGRKDILTALLEYIENLEKTAANSVEQQRAPETLSSEPIPTAYQSWWLDHFYYANLEFLYTILHEAEQPVIE